MCCPSAVPWQHWQLLGYPWPSHCQPAASEATASQVLAYVQSYAGAQGLRRHIKFACQLMHLALGQDGKYTAFYLDSSSGQSQQCQLEADFVVLATGRNTVPHIPQLPGQGSFQGTQVSRGGGTCERMRMAEH